jgi:ribose/xylose/arabinose/galactoside ABC-type transport system permease subunit
VYVLAGLFYGIASLLSVARTGAATRTRGRPENLDAISAVVLGGTSLFGGRGVILGTLVGALIVGVFRNGLTLMGVSSVYQILVTGILVILAVATDQLAQRSALIMTNSTHTTNAHWSCRPRAWSSAGQVTRSTAPTLSCAPAKSWP